MSDRPDTQEDDARREVGRSNDVPTRTSSQLDPDVRLTYRGQTVVGRRGETVLDALLRSGQRHPFSCRGGTCGFCLARADRGETSIASQTTLRPSLRRNGYFLPCVERVAEELAIEPPRPSDLWTQATVLSKRAVTPSLACVRLDAPEIVPYRLGQFVSVMVGGLVRSYSIAPTAEGGSSVELHVARVADGRMSRYLCDVVRPGDVLALAGPFGASHYALEGANRELVLVGTGTGIAPMFGILRDALAHSHGGPITIFHGVRRVEELYLDADLRDLARDHANVTYVPCVSAEDGPPGSFRGRVDTAFAARFADTSDIRLHLAGNFAAIDAVERVAIERGASVREILSDAFDRGASSHGIDSRAPSAIEGHGVVETHGHQRRRSPSEGDPVMWEALGRGEKLNAILHDFYSEVYADPMLGPYFRSVTKERIVGQVFSFLRDEWTGATLYFGMRPRSAHHWMVISDELFDHRARLMRACIVRHQLPAELVERWMTFEESFRPDIVKREPWRLIIDGVERPLDGYDELVLTSGTLCDGCGDAIESGHRVRYHLRLGTTFCASCVGDDTVSHGFP